MKQKLNSSFQKSPHSTFLWSTYIWLIQMVTLIKGSQIYECRKKLADCVKKEPPELSDVNPNETILINYALTQVA